MSDTPTTYYAVIEVFAANLNDLASDKNQILSRHVDLKIATLAMSYEYEEKPRNLCIIVMNGTDTRALTDKEEQFVRDTVAADESLTPVCMQSMSEKNMLMFNATEAIRIMGQLTEYRKSNPDKIGHMIDAADEIIQAFNASNQSFDKPDELTGEDSVLLIKAISMINEFVKHQRKVSSPEYVAKADAVIAAFEVIKKMKGNYSGRDIAEAMSLAMDFKVFSDNHRELHFNPVNREKAAKVMEIVNEVADQRKEEVADSDCISPADLEVSIDNYNKLMKDPDVFNNTEKAQAAMSAGTELSRNVKILQDKMTSTGFAKATEYKDVLRKAIYTLLSSRTIK